MEELRNKLQGKELTRATTNMEAKENEKKCPSPVFKCVYHSKPNRRHKLDSSDYDIPSYQLNQSVKSNRTSSKCGSEANDTVLPFSPIFSPIPVPTAQFQPPSIHSLGTVAKVQGKSSTNNVKDPHETASRKHCELAKSLGMNEKDISWVSSMASPPPQQLPDSEYNTIEKATFFPEDKFQNIQPRALFSPNFDEDFDCHPISFSSESEDDDAYKSNVRLSDVCATLQQLKVKSLDQPSEVSEEKTIKQDILVSPVIKTFKRKPELLKKGEKGALVESPKIENIYEFSVEEKSVDHDKPKPEDKSIFGDDDLFESLSFASIDELCKTVVNEVSDSSSASKEVDCEKPNNDRTSPQKINSKILYGNETSTNAPKACSADKGRSFFKRKSSKYYAVKGHFIYETYKNNPVIINSSKSFVSGIKKSDTSKEKECKKVEDENEKWEKMKEFMFESQQDLSENDLCRTVEMLEKSLAFQELPNGLRGVGGSLSENSSGSAPPKEAPGTSIKELERTNAGCCADYGAQHSSQNVASSEFKNVLGSEISVSENALGKGKEILENCFEGGLGCERALNGSDKVCQMSGGDLSRGQERANKSGEAQALRAEGSSGLINEEPLKGFSTVSGKRIDISRKAMEKAKEVFLDCDESSKKTVGNVLENSCSAKAPRKGKGFPKKWKESGKGGSERDVMTLERLLVKVKKEEVTKKGEEDVQGSLMKGFTTGSGKQVAISGEALEKAKALMRNCDEGLAGELEKVKGQCVSGENLRRSPEAQRALEGRKSVGRGPGGVPRDVQGMGFFTGSGKTVSVSAEALEKAKALMASCEVDESSGFSEGVPAVARSATSEGLRSRDGVLSDAKDFGVKRQKCPALQGGTKSAFLGFSTALGNKVNISNKGMEKAKMFWSDSEEKERSEEQMNETKMFRLAGPVVKDFSTREVPETVSTDEEWSRQEGVQEDGKSSTSPGKYIGHGKRKRQKLLFEEGTEEVGFGVPSRDSARTAAAKRSSDFVMDFSAPFKRAKFVDVRGVGFEMKEERERRRREQEEAIKEKHSVKPSKGSHLAKKCSEKQMSWMEAVGGSHPDAYSEEALRGFGVFEDVLRVSVTNAASFTFNGKHFFGPESNEDVEGFLAGDGCVLILDDENKVGVRELKRAFLASAGVQPNLVPDGWVENHYKWIVWKLAHYERSFPQHFAGRCLTPDNVLLQLRYRYDREIDRNERSALKKILERDDTSAKRLVLCVSGIQKVGEPDALRYELSLTDGWYSCPARSDPALARILDKGKLTVGTKLVTQGAVLVSDEQGVSPLEIGGDVHLRIATNSTRRVKWDTKLGFQKNPGNFPVSLNSILPQGGPISRIDVILVRVYPVLYMEKTQDGRHVTRNRRLEEKADAEYRKIKEQKWETICNEVEMEMRKTEKFGGKLIGNGLDECDRVGGTSQFQNLRADEWKCLENFQAYEGERFRREMSEKVEKRLEEILCQRHVSEFFRVKVVDMRKPDYNNPAVLSVWNPSEDLVASLAEGKVFSLLNLTVSNSSRARKPLQLNTTRQTQCIRLPRTMKYPARKLTRLKDVSSKMEPAFGEVDVVGVVFFVQDLFQGSKLSQMIYLADLEMNFVRVVFWGSCKDFGCENVLRISSVVTCTNLQWKKGNDSQDVPSLHVNETSIFTENPKHNHLKEEMERLKENNRNKMNAFVSECKEELMARLEGFNRRSDSSKSFLGKPSTSGETQPFRCQASCFGSKPTASSTPIKPFIAKLQQDEAEPSPIQKRIERLQTYGEPPSLMPLPINNNTKRKLTKNSVKWPK